MPSLGCLPAHPADHPHHRVRLASYLDTRVAGATAPRPMPSSWGLYRNLDLSTCGPAAVCNLRRRVSAGAGAEVDPDERVALDAYAAVSGWDPAQPASDVGVILSDLLAYCHTSAIGGLGGVVFDAFAEIEHADRDAMARAADLFGGVILRLGLPRAAQSMPDAWTDPPGALTGPWAPESWGGHAVLLLPSGRVVTWGGERDMGDGFAASYITEAWAALVPGWPVPGGLDLVALKEDLAAMMAIEVAQ